MIRVLSALANGARLAVFRLLSPAAPGETSDGAIGGRLGVVRTTSNHLANLRPIRLFEQRRSGGFILFPRVAGGDVGAAAHVAPPRSGAGMKGARHEP